MSYTNGTTHYNLPLTTGADKRDWSDTNQAFSDVDAALYGAVQDTAQAELDIDALETRMDTAEQNISTNTGNIAGLDTRLTTAEGAITSQGAQITDTRQDLEDMICAYNEASATSTHAYAIGDYFIYNDVLYKATQAIAIGDTIVPDTNCSTTNVTTELLATEDLSGDVAQLKTDMSAVQEDITELETDVSNLKKYRILGVVNHASNATNSTAINDVYAFLQANNIDPMEYNHIMILFWDSNAPFTFAGKTTIGGTEYSRFTAVYTSANLVVSSMYIEGGFIDMSLNGATPTDVGSNAHTALTSTVLYV